MKNSNKKKIVVLCAMLVLLIASGVLNFYLNDKLSPNKDNEIIDDGATSTYFGMYRTERESTRQEMFTYLDTVITSEATSAEAKTAAETQKLELVAKMESELTLENLIIARGFSDAVVTMSTGNINVVVKTDAELESSEVAQILSIITSETDYVASEVIIVPYTV